MTFELQVLILYWLSNSALAWHIHHRSTVHNWTPRARYHSEKIQWERERETSQIMGTTELKDVRWSSKSTAKVIPTLLESYCVLSFRAQNQRPYCSSFIWQLPPAHWILRCFCVSVPYTWQVLSASWWPRRWWRQQKGWWCSGQGSTFTCFSPLTL